jgi:hypothetical protein
MSLRLGLSLAARVQRNRIRMTCRECDQHCDKCALQHLQCCSAVEIRKSDTIQALSVVALASSVGLFGPCSCGAQQEKTDEKE